MKKEKIQELISRMTLEEKAGMCSGADFWHLKGIERLGIPQVMVTDGPHGIRKQAEEADHLGINESEKAVCFPAGCATASSFDRDLIRRQGEILGQECQAMNVSTILGPAMNIKRSPLCGRNFEYYSEDPFVSAEIFVQRTSDGTTMLSAGQRHRFLLIIATALIQNICQNLIERFCLLHGCKLYPITAKS